MTMDTDCELCAGEHDADAHGAAVFHVDDRRPPETYALDIAAELLAIGVEHGERGDYYPREYTPILAIWEDARTTTEALRYCEDPAHYNADRVADHSQWLSELAIALEDQLAGIGLVGGFDADVGGFIAWRAVDD